MAPTSLRAVSESGSRAFFFVERAPPAPTLARNRKPSLSFGGRSRSSPLPCMGPPPPSSSSVSMSARSRASSSRRARAAFPAAAACSRTHRSAPSSHRHRSEISASRSGGTQKSSTRFLSLMRRVSARTCSRSSSRSWTNSSSRSSMSAAHRRYACFKRSIFDVLLSISSSTLAYDSPAMESKFSKSSMRRRCSSAYVSILRIFSSRMRASSTSLCSWSSRFVPPFTTFASIAARRS